MRRLADTIYAPTRADVLYLSAMPDATLGRVEGLWMGYDS